MSSNDRLQGGMKHAPGVMCIIRGIPARFPAYRENNKIVKLLEALPLGGTWQCACGCSYKTSLRFGIFWKVEGPDLLDCGRLRIIGTIGRIPQKFLIPIGDSSLIEGEKWEATNPKEDKLERASVLVARFRKAYPELIEKFEKLKETTQ